jgi:hypothetical protein
MAINYLKKIATNDELASARLKVPRQRILGAGQTHKNLRAYIIFKVPSHSIPFSSDADVLYLIIF